MAQGFLPFQYETERGAADQTGHAGLLLGVELFRALGLREVIAKEVGVRRETQGYTDWQVVLALMLLNLAGGDCVEDLNLLEKDRGFAKAYRLVEEHGLSRKRRKELRERFPAGRERSFPSPSAAFRYLEGFHVPGPLEAPAGKAYVPPAPAGLLGLRRVNAGVLERSQKYRPSVTATLDMDATAAETHKREANYCYRGFKAYQPLNVYWWEQELVAHSEFRDGNVPAGFELKRVLAEALTYLPSGVKKVYLRSDSAGYAHELLGYCDDGESRFGRIEFAVSCDVTAQFKAAVKQVPEEEWRPLSRREKGKPVATGREWAEVCFVPNRVCGKKWGREYRYLATREALSQPPLPGMGEQLELPFPTLAMNDTHYKVFGVVTNRTLPGDELILWHDQRSGRSEAVHDVMKNELAGGQFPSGDFGENAAWWAIMILSYNLQTALKRLALGGSWAHKRLKALRFHFLNLSARVLVHAGRLFLRIADDHPSFELLLQARSNILALARAP